MYLTSKLIVAAHGPGQDQVLVLQAGARVVLAVADGAGGRSGGGEASHLAITLIRDRIGEVRDSNDSARLLSAIDEAIERNPIAGESTGALAIVDETGIFGASVGDSGAWVFGAHTPDDLTRNQIRKPFLGTGQARPIGFSRPAVNGTILLATDGLLKYASFERIAETLKGADLDAVTKALITLVRYPSGALPDDVGIALCRQIQS